MYGCVVAEENRGFAAVMAITRKAVEDEMMVTAPTVAALLGASRPKEPSFAWVVIVEQAYKGTDRSSFAHLAGY